MSRHVQYQIYTYLRTVSPIYVEKTTTNKELKYQSGLVNPSYM